QAHVLDELGNDVLVPLARDAFLERFHVESGGGMKRLACGHGNSSVYAAILPAYPSAMPWSFLANNWFEIALAAYFVWVLGATWTILQQRRAPAATLSWIFAFIALPFVSGLYYIVFGPRRLHRRRIRYGVARRAIVAQIQEYIRSSASKVKPQLTSDVAAMAKVVSRLGQGDPTFAASVKLLDSGDHYLSALERAIQAAKHHIHCEYYIWEPD